ncbi:MAG: tRNA pseudouridine(38-40) synthase TruA [Desulfurobacteriaceae bacterium]
MRNLKLTVEYLGTNYYGWQVLPDKPTVAGEIIKALRTILKEEVKLIGASRTDAGVHARGQVANFKTEKEIPKERLIRGLNGLLPPDIKVTKIEEVPLDFDSRRNAKGKEYLYRIFNRSIPSPFEYRRSWFFPFPLNTEKMAEASSFLIGVHDFTSFSKKDRSKEVNPIREVNEIKIERIGNTIEIRVWGRSFLRHMVRVMVATLVKVGEGKLKPEDVKEILEGRNRERAPFLAPADGLYLEKVFYEDYPY